VIAGVRIGFIGISTPETMTATAKDNITGLVFADPIEHAKNAIANLQEAGVDVIVAVAHLGMEGENTSIALAETVPEIDVIIDGHSHTMLPDGHIENGVLIASTGDYTKNLGVVTLTFDADNNLISKNASLLDAETVISNYEPDEEVLALVTAITEEQSVVLNEVITVFETDLISERALVRTQEMPLGNLVADALMTQTGADIAFINGGGLRADLPAGEVTKRHVVACLPFGNYGVTKYVTPALLKDLMENGVSGFPEESGAFPQVAGFSFTFDPAKKPGNRVMEITMNGNKLDLTDTVTQILLATNDFMAGGGDKYALGDVEIVSEHSALDEMLITYLQGSAKIYTEKEGRIIEASVREFYIPPAAA
jgi:5'-nucleotidase